MAMLKKFKLPLLFTLFALAAGYKTFSPMILTLDEGTYLQTLRWLNSGQKLYSQIFYSQFPPFIQWAQFFSSLGGPTLAFARLGTLFWALIGLFAIYRIGLYFERQENLKGLAWIYLALLATDNVYFHLSHALLGDASSTAIFLIAIALSLEKRKASPLWFALAGAIAAAAVLMKAVVLPLLIILLFTGLWAGPGALALGAVGFLTTLFAVLFSDGYFALGAWAQLQGGAIGQAFHLGPKVSVAQKISLFFLHSGGYLPFGNVLVPVFAIFSLRQMWKTHTHLAKPLTIILLSIIAVFLWHKNVNFYHFVIFSPLLLFPIAMALAKSPRQWPLIGVLSVNLILLGTSFVWDEGHVWMHARKIKIEHTLEQCTAKDDWVISDDNFATAMADRMPPPQLVDVAPARLYFRSLTCEKMKPYFTDPKVKTVVITVTFDKIDCGPEAFEHLVLQEFPYLILQEKKIRIYARQPCPTLNSQGRSILPQISQHAIPNMDF